MSRIIVDTGPLVAYLDRSDHDHPWAKDQFMSQTDPLLTCEAVIAETLFLLGRGGIAPDGLLALVERDLVIPEFSLRPEIEAVSKLMRTYRDTPMSLADACLVRMSEIHESSLIMTLDSDFTVYRKSRRRIVPVIMPPR
ncbi:MAG: PIN domain-containing protein [Akkermansiaceae bacterium]|nr:PIN domain-containing protein [Akkermansiaceae bacterium]MCP5543900.1 PIN domain-containing protein [Akkermansiaceae bacterium]MCP5547532.1 PIN domain-containing protein [Akkermansiaceae bacterium]